MVERIYNEIKTIHEMNETANNLRSMGMKDGLTRMALRYNIPKNTVEDFWNGKRYYLLDGGNTGKFYETPRAKVLDEMLKLKDPAFGDIIGKYIIRNQEELNLGDKILLEHKTLQRCIEYVMEQAYALVSEDAKQKRVNTGLAVSEEEVYAWVKDYYLLDDKEKWKKKAEEDEKSFINAQKKPEKDVSPEKQNKVSGKTKSGRSKKKSSEKAAQTVKELKPQAEKKEVPLKEQMDGQVSLFDAGLQTGGTQDDHGI